MDTVQVVVILGSIIGLGAFGALAYLLLGGAGGKSSELRGLMAGPGGATQGRASRGDTDPFDVRVEDLRKRNSKSSSKKRNEDVSTKLFKAGYFTADDRRWFYRLRIGAFVACLILCPIGIFYATGNPMFTVMAVILGGLSGFALPMSWLERQIRRREDEVMYFLPLVIEQVSIGVSSALDVGPCISQIVEMANERDSHNAVTEMFVHVEKLIRSGLSLEDSLIEVGEANGTTEVKHAFMFLAQCAKHGGEVSRQLQELADSVMVQRQTQIEAKITALPVKATGPLATVFAGFFALLFAGLLVRLLSAFGG